MSEDAAARDRPILPSSITELADTAQPREVTSATFSYVDAMLTGRLSDLEFGRIRDEILGDSASVAAEAEPADPDQELLDEIERRVSAKDYGGAMAQAEEILHRRPGHEAATRFLDHARAALSDVYQRHLGERHDVPYLAVPPETLPELGLDRWAAYFLSVIDGRSSLDDLVDVAGLHRLDTLRIVYELLQRGVVGMKKGGPPNSRPESVSIARIRLQRREG